VDKPVELVPLRCLKCQTPIPANANEIAWVCVQCAQGLLLDEESGLVALDVHYASAIPPEAKGKPYWVATGKVELIREAYTSSTEMEASQRYWGEGRRFFVPAYSCPMETVLNQGIQYLDNPPLLEPGETVPFEAVTLALKDMQPLAEFIVLAIEAGRSDQLKRVEISLELETPALWILP
jgi:hypothetical protein